MGSSGSSNFSDYTETPRKPLPPQGKRTGVSGGSSGEDPCDKAITTSLEDVGLSDYFKKRGTVPPQGTAIVIELRKRIVAVTRSGESIGNLPTKFNYLAQCMQAGRKYTGNVQSSAAGLLPRVNIDAAPV